LLKRSDRDFGAFGAVGALRQPAKPLLNVRLTYHATSRLQPVATFANVITQRFSDKQIAFIYGNGPEGLRNEENWTRSRRSAIVVSLCPGRDSNPYNLAATGT